MSPVADHVLNRLTALLPLPARQAALPPELRKLHRSFLRSLVERGRVMTESEIAAMAPGGDGSAAIWTLASLDLIVLGMTGAPVGAYPVTTERTPHEVTVDGTRIWAMCAFDAVSVEPMFGTPVVTRSRCPVTGAEILIEQRGGRIATVRPSPAVQVGVWWRNPGAVAARNFCPGIMFLRDTTAALQWQAGLTVDHEFCSLEDAVEAGARFFRPLLEQRMPEPAGV
jgi:mercuric reductase